MDLSFLLQKASLNADSILIKNSVKYNYLKQVL